MAGCDGTYAEGLEYCNTMNGDYQLDILLPDREFLDKYPYKDGNFYYYNGFFVTSKSLLYLKYDEETYSEAKKELFARSVLSDYSFNYKGFVFYQSIFLEEDSTYREDIKFEGLDTWFAMIAYNDEKGTLVSAKYCKYYKDDYDIESVKTDEDFAEFIERYFLEFYNFE